MNPRTLRCREALDRMMEAGPAGAGDSVLSAHIRHCGRCRRAAEVLADAEGALDAWLADAGELDVDAVLARARSSEAGPARPSKGRERAGFGAAARRWPSRAWIVPALAAAAALLLLLPRTDPPPPSVGTDGASPRSAAAMDLVVPEGRDAAVIQARDPNITVVWFFNGDES